MEHDGTSFPVLFLGRLTAEAIDVVLRTVRVGGQGGEDVKIDMFGAIDDMQGSDVWKMHKSNMQILSIS